MGEKKLNNKPMKNVDEGVLLVMAGEVDADEEENEIEETDDGSEVEQEDE